MFASRMFGLLGSEAFLFPLFPFLMFVDTPEMMFSSHAYLISTLPVSNRELLSITRRGV